MELLNHYFLTTPIEKQQKKVIAYLAAIDHLSQQDPEIGHAILQELKDQRSYLKLIASENFSSLETQLAAGNLLTDKYCEGNVKRRFYAGCENVDVVEGLAAERLKELFKVDHAYVQPHSGADANLVAFWAILTQRIQNKEIEKLGKKTALELSQQEYEKIRELMLSQKLMGMSIDSGGHLTHGFRMNVSSKIFHAVPYNVDSVTELLDYKALKEQAQKEKPTILIAGYSSYPRLIDFAKMKEIADSVGAVLMADIAHFSGLVAGGVLTGDFNPVGFCDIITSTTHKTLRGPRGGVVMCTKEYKEAVDKGCPMVLGGPLPHIMAAKAIAFKEALMPSFKEYAKQILKNAKALSEVFLAHGLKLFSGGTDNHLVVIDVQESFGLTGRQAETALREAHITVNRNMVPFDKNGAWNTSGIRLGSPAMTTLGMKEEEMKKIALWIIQALKATHVENADGLERQRCLASVDPKVAHTIKQQVKELLSQYPLYPELKIE